MQEMVDPLIDPRTLIFSIRNANLSDTTTTQVYWQGQVLVKVPSRLVTRATLAMLGPLLHNKADIIELTFDGSYTQSLPTTMEIRITRLASCDVATPPLPPSP
ncbi:MAG: hypothetical protein JWM57_1962 [Phycisphaerales bacterium]|nr:hypothetical protein [Phycisphaerales bacterium]